MSAYACDSSPWQNECVAVREQADPADPTRPRKAHHKAARNNHRPAVTLPSAEAVAMHEDARGDEDDGERGEGGGGGGDAHAKLPS